MAAGLLGLGGCSDHQASGPVAWWHDAVGGKIAEQRPPPPGDKDPYPNLSTIPAKPARPNSVAMNRMTAGLISDRINANQAAALAPIITPATRAVSSPGPVVPREDAASASLVATSRPPAQTAPQSPAAAPRVENPSAPAPAVAVGTGAAPPKTVPAASSVVPPAAPQIAAPQVASAELPALPTQEPPRANVAPRPPPRLVPLTAAPPPQTPRPADGAVIDFTARSPALNAAALDQIKAAAATRGTRGIAVTGHGEAASSDPLRQAAALELALARAQAVATSLVAAGVPSVAVRVNAEAAGRGASLRLLP